MRADGRPSGVTCRKGHGVRLAAPGGDGLVEPAVKEREGIVAGLRSIRPCNE